MITSVEDEEVQGGMAEDEDEELQRALMSSLNPNASPAQPRRSAGLPHIAPRAPMRTQPPADPAVANARRLRNEQDRAYQESLAEDREKVILIFFTLLSPLSLLPLLPLLLLFFALVLSFLSPQLLIFFVGTQS